LEVSSAGSGASGYTSRARGGRDLSISGFALLGFLAWIGWKMVCIGSDTFEFCLGEFLFLSGLLLLSIIVLFTARTFYNNAFDDGLAFHSLMVLVMDIVSSVMLAAIFIIHCYYSIIVYFRRCHGEKTEANEMAALIGLTVLAVQWIIIITCIVVAVLAALPLRGVAGAGELVVALGARLVVVLVVLVLVVLLLVVLLLALLVLIVIVVVVWRGLSCVPAHGERDHVVA